MARTLIAHLNIEIADDDQRTTEDFQRLIDGIIEVGTPTDESATIEMTGIEEL